MSVDQWLAMARQTAPQPGLAARLGLDSLDERREFEALPVLEQALRHYPGDATLWQIKALLHRALGDLAPAITALERALAIRPDDAKLVHTRARAELEAGRSSLDWFAKARRLAPTDDDVVLGTVAALLAEDSAEAAEQWLSAAIQTRPTWLAGHGSLARLRFAQGRRDDYLDSVARALSAAPRHPELHRLHLSLALRANDFSKLDQAMAGAASQLGEDHPLLLAYRAMAATERGALGEADAAFDRLPWQDAIAYIHRLRHLIRRQRLEPLLSGSAPDDVHAWPYRLLAHRMLGAEADQWNAIRPLVRIYDLPIEDGELTALAGTLRRLHRTSHQPLDQSLRQGTQTDGLLLCRLDPPLRRLAARLMQVVGRYHAQVPATAFPAGKPRHPRFVGSWSARFLGGGGHHDPHVHGDGWISSAFYVVVPEENGEAGWLTLGQPQASLGTGLPPLARVQPKPGRLVLFPSMLWHGTLPFTSGERMTVAFDIA